MDIFKFAMQMESDGEQYYHRLASQANDSALASVLNMLADDERKHYNTLERMKDQDTGMAKTTILNDAKNVFVEISRKEEKTEAATDQVEPYTKAMEIERQSEDFYRQKAVDVQQEYQKGLFLRLAEEEHKHYILLEKIIEFISRPKTWLENAEFNHLDEY